MTPPKFSFKKSIFISLSLLLLLALSACTAQQAAPTATPPSAAQNDQSAASDGPIELVIWAERFTQESITTDPNGAGQYGRYLIEKFEEENPGVTVRIEYQGWDETLRQNLFNALLIGSAPDIVVGENYFQQFAELGALVPLNEAITDIQDDLIPGTYQAAEYNGQIYGLSAFTGVFGFERNCAVVTAAGLDCDTAPETWDDLLNHARLITEAGNGDYYGYSLQGPVGTSVGGAFRIAVFLTQNNAPICRNNCTEPYFNNPNVIPVMEFIRQLNQYTPPGLTTNPDEGQVYSALFEGRSAYQIAGSWHPGWASDSGCEDCRYSAVPIPEGGQPASLVVGNVMYAVLAESDHTDIAIEWVKFLARPDVQELVYPTLGRLPSTRSALTNLRPDVDPATQAFIDQILENPELAVLPQWRTQPQQMWQIYNEMLTEVLTTDRPIPEILDEAQATAEAVQ